MFNKVERKIIVCIGWVKYFMNLCIIVILYLIKFTKIVIYYDNEIIVFYRLV